MPSVLSAPPQKAAFHTEMLECRSPCSSPDLELLSESLRRQGYPGSLYSFTHSFRADAPLEQEEGFLSLSLSHRNSVPKSKGDRGLAIQATAPEIDLGSTILRHDRKGLQTTFENFGIMGRKIPRIDYSQVEVQSCENARRVSLIFKYKIS